MKSPKSLALLLAVSLGGAPGAAFSAEPTPAVAEGAKESASVSPAELQKAIANAKPEITDVLKSLGTKAQASGGAGFAPGAFADEIKTLDGLVEKWRTDAPEDAAMALFFKSVVYFEIVDDFAAARTVIAQMKKEFPATLCGRFSDQLLDDVAAKEKQAEGAAKLAIGLMPPAFEVKDLDGQPLSLEKFKGKVVLLDFWATWCGPCVAELPQVLKTYEAHHGEGFEIVGISLDQDKEALTSFLTKRKMTWPQFFDGKGWKNEVSTLYGISSIPATFLLDREGRIVAKDLRGEALETAVAKALKPAGE